MKKAVSIWIFLLVFSLSIYSQVAAPRQSQRQMITQTVGDATVSMVYHRPNVNGRKIWGALVPYDKVWRSGANEATVFEVSRDVSINGKPLPAGKYSLHTIPSKTAWTIIFNKTWDQWGSFDYEEKQDALRITAKPVKADFRDSLAYDFEKITPTSTQTVLRWERIAVPFTIDIGDIHGRVMSQMRAALGARKADDPRPLNQAGNYVVTFKLKEHYTDAGAWIDQSIAIRETFGNLGLKARLLAGQGKTADAIAYGEKAIAAGKASNPPANINSLNSFQETVNEWKSKK